MVGTASYELAMTRAVETLGRIPSPPRLFLRILVIFFVIEGAVMLILPSIEGFVPVAALIVDDVLLMVLSAPFLWFAVVRPLRGVALREHARAATVLAHARDGIVTINSHGMVESFNPAAERIFGYAAEEVLDRPVTMLVPARYRDAHRRRLEELAGTNASRVLERVLEGHGLRKDGTDFPVELSLATWRAREGTFHTAVVRDITERKHAEETMQARTNQLEAIRAVAAEITGELELDALLNLITRRAAELLGVKSGSVLLWDEQSQQFCPRTWCGFGDWFKTVKLGLGEGLIGAITPQRQGWIIRDCSASPHVFPDLSEKLGTSSLVDQPLVFRDRLLGAIILSNQGTQRVFTEQDLETLGLFADQAAITIENARLYQEVQSLAIVKERQRLAREMHDSFAQTLGLLHLQLGKVREDHAGIDPHLTAALNDLTRMSEHAYDELRQSIFGLRTMVSRGLGWIPTLTEYLHEFSTRTGIRVTLQTSEEVPDRLPPATEVQFVRIIQEALANVQKHARADHARVRLEREAPWLRVTIEDNGQGFQRDGSDVGKPNHFGLQTMRERAESLGGRLEIVSAPGSGTRVIATVPGEV
jgi:PAS domain S-box-containing protein